MKYIVVYPKKQRSFVSSLGKVAQMKHEQSLEHLNNLSNILCYILSGLKLFCELKSSISTNQCFVQDLKCVLYPLTAGRATDMPLPTAIIVGDHAGPTSSSVTPLKYHIMRLFPCYSGQAARRERWLAMPWSGKSVPWGTRPTSSWGSSRRARPRRQESDEQLPLFPTKYDYDA